MSKDFKKYNKTIFVSLFSTFVLLALFNWSVDAYDVFKFPKISHYNKLKPQAGMNQRVTKILSYKLDNKELDSVFLGSSRVNSSISEDYYEKITDKRTKNFGMNALSHDETIKLARFSTIIHPEIKTVYIGLDFFRFLEANKDNKRTVPMSFNKKITISELNPLILSFTTTLSGYETVRYNIHNKISKGDTIAYFTDKLNHYKNNYKDAILADSEFEKLIGLKSELEQNGYKVVFYTNPTHAADLALIEEMGQLEVFDNWKRKLAKSFTYTDFDFVNEITSEKITQDIKYFVESSHASYAAGNLIMDNLVLHNNNYGLITNEANVNSHILQNKKNLQKWKKENPDWMKKIKDICDAV